MGDVAGVTDAAKWDSGNNRFEFFGREICNHIGFDDPGGHRVNTDAIRGEFASERFSEAIDREF